MWFSGASRRTTEQRRGKAPFILGAFAAFMRRNLKLNTPCVTCWIIPAIQSRGGDVCFTPPQRFEKNGDNCLLSSCSTNTTTQKWFTGYFSSSDFSSSPSFHSFTASTENNNIAGGLRNLRLMWNVRSHLKLRAHKSSKVQYAAPLQRCAPPFPLNKYITYVSPSPET